MVSPLVSIIVPAYNSAATLDRCIRSIQAQTENDWELLLADNGSVDNTFELMSEYARADRRIRALRDLNKGVSFARNTALDNARGEYVCFVDSDDEIEPDYLEVLLNKLDADLTVCGYFVDAETQNGQRSSQERHITESVLWRRDMPKDTLAPAFENGFMHLCCNKLFRRKLIEDHRIRFMQYPVNEDYIFTLSFLKFADSVAISDKPLYHWIRVEHNASGVKSIPDNLLDIYNLSHRQCRDFFKENFRIADRIAYFSYELIIYKYYEAIALGRITRETALGKIRDLIHNDFVKAAYKAYRPSSMGERVLHALMKNGLYRIHYMLSQKVLK